jgi:hypothetical protein
VNDPVLGQPLEVWLARVAVVISERAEIRNLTIRNVCEHQETDRRQTSSGDDAEPYRHFTIIVPAKRGTDRQPASLLLAYNPIVFRPFSTGEQVEVERAG